MAFIDFLGAFAEISWHYSRTLHLIALCLRCFQLLAFAIQVPCKVLCCLWPLIIELFVGSMTLDDMYRDNVA